MITTFPIIVFFLLHTGATFIAPTSRTSEIKAINKYINLIDHRFYHYRPIEKDLDTGTDGGGELHVFAQNAVAAKVIVIIYLSDHALRRVYYVKHRQLVAVIESSKYFHPVSTTKYVSSPTRIPAVTYYLRDNKVVAIVEKNKSIHLAPPAVARKSSDLTDELRTFIKVSHSPDNRVDISQLFDHKF